MHVSVSAFIKNMHVKRRKAGRVARNNSAWQGSPSPQPPASLHRLASIWGAHGYREGYASRAGAGAPCCSPRAGILTQKGVPRVHGADTGLPPRTHQRPGCTAL